MDFSGHGRSSRKASSYRVVDYLDDALLLLRQRVYRPAVLYGHSLGAMVALATAAQEPSRVRGLILEDPPFHAMGRRLPGSPLHSFFLGIHHALREDLSLAGLTSRLAALRVPDPPKNQGRTLGELRDITSLRFTAKCLKQMDPGVLCSILDGLWLEGYDQESLLRRIRCPTLVLQADAAAGGMLSEEDADQIEQCIPDCSRVRIPNGHHLLHWTSTETVQRLVTGFLESLSEEGNG